jgi:hypothetical protein
MRSYNQVIKLSSLTQDQVNFCALLTVVKFLCSDHGNYFGFRGRIDGAYVYDHYEVDYCDFLEIALRLGGVAYNE